MTGSIQDTSGNPVPKPDFRYGMERLGERLEKLPVLVFILIVGLVIPLLINIGPLRLSVYRIVLLVLFFPALHALLTGKAGRIRGPDICVILICFWSVISITIIHGVADKVETIGITVVETLGAYLIGRVWIRSPEAFFAMVKLFFSLTLLILPLAVYETVTSHNIILNMFDMIGQTYPDVFKSPRWGLDRVQGPFAHPIHFGVFFGSLIGVTYYVLGYGKSVFGKLSRTGIVMVVGMLALSSGPLTALVAQVFFIGWDLVLRRFRSRWYILGGLAVSGYIFIDVLSNRNPFQVFISKIAFSTNTASARLYIWDWGTKSIFNNPVFGIGFNDWERPYWMLATVDMFWILPGMRHGIVVWFLFFLLFFWVFLRTAYAKISDPRIRAYRTGYLATLSGLFMAGWTVHYWDATLVLFMFLLSSGMWIADENTAASEDVTSPPTDNTRHDIRYSRFEPKHHRADMRGPV